MMAKKLSSDVFKELEKMGCKVSRSLEDLDFPYVLKTGIFSLDVILSDRGGLNVGCVECHGQAGVGKSSLALSTMVEAQKIGLDTYYVIMERGITKDLAACFGLDADKVNWIKPSHGEAALNAIETILRTKKRTFIVLDSIPACIPMATMEEGAEKKTYGGVANLFSVFMPKANVLCEESESTLMLLNQMRSNIDPYSRKKYKASGGWAVQYYPAIIIEMRKGESIKKGANIIGHRIKVKTEKNRYTRPFQTVDIALLYGKGFPLGYDLLDLGLQLGLIKKASGGRYDIEGVEGSIRGEMQTAKFIVEHKEIEDRIKEEVEKSIQ